MRKFEAPTRTITDLSQPWGVAVDKRGQIIVTEGSKHHISIYNSETKIRSLGREGSDFGDFQNPRCVAVDGAGNILVMDEDNHRIQKFTTDGTFLQSKGNKALQFDRPMGIGISSSDKVYM